MLEGPLVFVDVDTQRDFLDPDGALFVAGSTEIRGRLARLTDFARTHRIPVLATACAHSPEDLELQRFAPHCMIGSPGQARVPETSWPGGMVLGLDERLEGELPAHLTLEKRELDVFTHPDVERLLRLYDRNRPTFVVYGVATEYCVACAAGGLLERGCRVALVADAIRAIDPGREAEVLTELVSRGATLVLTDVVCDGEPNAR